MADITLIDPPSLWRLYASLLRPNGRRPTGLPSRRLRVARQPVEAAAVGAYTGACGFALRDEVPPTFVHVLTMPLQLTLIAARDFPLPGLGMVHTANAITVLHPVRIGEVLQLTVWAADLRRRSSGAAVVDVHAQAHRGDDLVWTGFSSYLAPKVTLPEEFPASAQSADETGGAQGGPEVGRAVARWRLDADCARRYAAVSGDRNPIHLNRLAAKAFGFPSTIAHGMYSHARSLAQLGPRLVGPCRVSVVFKRPVLLPSTVSVHVGRDRDEVTVELRRPDRDGYLTRTRVTPYPPMPRRS
jgi:acyl dehydratase